MVEALQAYLSQAPELGWNAFWISQLLILFAFFCDGMSWQSRSREKILAWVFVSTLFIGTHFILLEQTTAALLTFLIGIRSLVAIRSTHYGLSYLFITLSLVIGLLTQDSKADLLAMTASMVASFAAFRPSDKSLRKYSMISTSMFIAYNVIIFSPAAVILDINFLLSNFIGYYRFYIRKPKNLTTP